MFQIVGLSKPVDWDSLTVLVQEALVLKSKLVGKNVGPFYFQGQDEDLLYFVNQKKIADQDLALFRVLNLLMHVTLVDY